MEVVKPDIKKIGLNMAEDLVKSVVKEIVRPMLEYYIAKSPNKIDDIMLPFMQQLEDAVLELADKIDGEVG